MNAPENQTEAIQESKAPPAHDVKTASQSLLIVRNFQNVTLFYPLKGA